VTAKKKQPTVFIGSSTEGVNYANGVFAELAAVAESTVWNQNLFAPTKGNLEEIERLSRQFDFAVLVMTPDDQQTKRNKQQKAARDNVLIEVGIFIGSLGRDRVFILSPQNQSVSVPTDLLGTGLLQFDMERTDQNQRAAVCSACQQITSRIQSIGVRKKAPEEVLFWDSIIERQRVNKDVRGLIANAKKCIFLSGITLSYVVTKCHAELSTAIFNGVQVQIVISNGDTKLIPFYSRYSNSVEQNLPLAVLRYQKFFNTLPESKRSCFSVYLTRAPMVHSIGFYDDDCYVSEFCIDADSSNAVSFRVTPDMQSYTSYVHEKKVLLNEADTLVPQNSAKI
jgi:Predicted nucleotide-binding protein containing TIR-like domain